MSNIDEILKQADDYADAERALASLLADECDQLRRNMLRLLLEGAIAAALADARREGGGGDALTPDATKPRRDAERGFFLGRLQGVSSAP